MSDVKDAALRVCLAASGEGGMSNPTAHIAAWLVGIASATGGFPIEVTRREIQFGYNRSGVSYPGTGCHNNTIRDALQWLEHHGLIKMSHGEHRGGGHHSILLEFVK